MSGRRLVDPATVTLSGLATALNGFFVTFLERCIKENEEFAAAQESDCYRENCLMNDKVSKWICADFLKALGYIEG